MFAVETAQLHAELWWLRLAEAVAETADAVDLVPGGRPVPWATGLVPAAGLLDTPTLRSAIHDLLAAVQAALGRHAAQARDGRRKLAATLAAVAAAHAAAHAAGGPEP